MQPTTKLNLTSYYEVNDRREKTEQGENSLNSTTFSIVRKDYSSFKSTEAKLYAWNLFSERLSWISL